MATTNKTCPDCGGLVVVTLASFCRDGQLMWSASHRCNACQYAVEEDGSDAIPADYRELEMQQDGAWAVQLRATETSVAAALKLIREHLDLSLPQTARLKEQLPGPILWGTRGEVATMAYHLSEAGITAELVPAEADGHSNPSSS